MIWLYPCQSKYLIVNYIVYLNNILKSYVPSVWDIRMEGLFKKIKGLYPGVARELESKFPYLESVFSPESYFVLFDANVNQGSDRILN